MIELNKPLFNLIKTNEPNLMFELIYLFHHSAPRVKNIDKIENSSPEKKECFNQIFTLLTITQLGIFKSFEQIPEIKQYLSQLQLSQTTSILNDILSIHKKTKYVSTASSHDEAYELFTQEYLDNIKKENFSIWNFNIKKNNSFAKIFDSDVGQYILKHFQPEDFKHAFDPHFSQNCNYIVPCDSFLRAILSLYDNHPTLLGMYEHPELKKQFTEGINLTHWNYIWRIFKIEPTHERSVGIHQFLEELKILPAHDLKISIFNNIDSWQKKSSVIYFTQQVEAIDNSQDIIVDSLPSISILLDLNNVKKFYKTRNNEKKFRDSSFFQSILLTHINKHISPENPLFCYSATGKTIIYNDFDYLCFTFMHKSPIDSKKIEEFYRKIILHVLKYGYIEKEAINTLSEEFTLNDHIPHNLGIDKKLTLKF